MANTAGQAPTVTDFDAKRFLRALANDALNTRGMGTGGSVNMQATIEKLLSDAETQILGENPTQEEQTARATEIREAAANQLISSFGKLGNRALPEEMQTMIRGVFTDPALTNAEDMARRVRESNFTANFVQLVADNHLNFGNVFDDNIMVMMQAMFPQLAQLLQDLGLGDDPHQTGSERRIEAELAAGWSAWQNGTVHQFNEISARDGNNNPVTLRSWRSPGSEHDINEFFGHGDTTHSLKLWGDDEDFKFTEAEPAGRPNTFAGIILQRWEDQGVVEFTGTEAEQREARDQFIQRSHALAVGGELDATFADTLVDRDVIAFSSPDERQAFIDHMIAWRDEPGGQQRDAQEIMQEVIDYVNQPGGAEWINPDFSDETETQFSTTQSAVYRVAQQYSITRNGEDYAKQMMRFAEEHPHITIAPPPAEPRGGPSAAAGDPNRTPPPSSPDPASPDPIQIQAVHFDANETSHFLDYGNAITGDFNADTMSFTANDGTEVFKFSNDFEVYGINRQTAALGGHSLTMEALDMNGQTPQQILESLGSDFKVSVVAHQDEGMDVGDSELVGFYIESADGNTSFYVGPSAIEEGSLTDAGKSELVKGIEETPGLDRTAPGYNVNTDPNNSASAATNDRATVDGQQNNLNVFQP